MKNKGSGSRIQITVGSLLFVLALIAEMYIMIHYPQQTIGIVGIAVLALVCAYAAVSGLLDMREQWETRLLCLCYSSFCSSKCLEMYVV